MNFPGSVAAPSFLVVVVAPHDDAKMDPPFLLAIVHWIDPVLLLLLSLAMKQAVVIAVTAAVQARAFGGKTKRGSFAFVGCTVCVWRETACFPSWSRWVQLSSFAFASASVSFRFCANPAVRTATTRAVVVAVVVVTHTVSLSLSLSLSLSVCPVLFRGNNRSCVGV